MNMLIDKTITKVGIIIIAISVSLFLIILGVFIFMSTYGQRKFDGTCVATSDSYCLDIEQMNGTNTHVMKLNKGDVLDIHFETSYGKLKMEIKAPDGTLIYTGNGEETTDFTVNISENGEYYVFVKAHKARGMIHIKRLISDSISKIQE